MSNTKSLPFLLALFATSLFERQVRIFKKTLLVFLLILFSTAASAGISIKHKDNLKLIGTSYALNGNFAWIELNGEDYGWIREGGYVGGYKIIQVEMGKVTVKSVKKTQVLVMLKGPQPEAEQ